MKPLVAALFLAVAALPAQAEPETFTIDPNHTFPTFEYTHFGVSVQRGRFGKTTGKVTVDTAAKTGNVEAVIDATTVEAGPPRLAEHLRSADFFDVAKHPTAAFKGSAFTFDGDKVKSVAGELTILGVTKPVTLTAVAFNCGQNPQKKRICGGDFATTIKRSDFGMSKFVPAVSDEVVLRIGVEAFKD